MAATTTAKLIQVRPNHHRLNTFRLLSSSSTTPTPPPQSDDNKPPPEPNPSGSQFSSYFNDVKSTLKQSQQQMNPSSFRPFPAPNSPPPAQKLPSLEEIGKTLSGFRHRTVPSSTPAGNQPPSSSSSFQQISFQDILKRNLNSSGLQGGSPLPNDEKPGTPKFSSIRESLNQLKLTTAANNPKLTKSMAEYQQSVRLRLHPNDHQGRIDSDSNKVIGGTDPLPLVVFGKELGFAEDYPAMRTEFVKDYKVEELGEKLKSLRPEKKKGENKDWFSLFELNERLAKLREMELEMEKGNNGPIGDMKNVLMKLKVSNQDKIRKESMQRLESRDVLTRHGRTPSFMLEPPKEELVEKYFHPDNMSASEKLKLELQKIRDEFKMSETDCGSARVQVAQLTTKINHLAGVLHKKDKHSRKGLQGMLQKRKSLLKYLRRTDWESYSFVLSRLGLRDNPDMKR